MWHGEGHSGTQDRKPYYADHSFKKVPGFLITFQQKFNNSGQPLYQRINNFASLYKGYVDLTQETYFKYKRNSELDYRLEMVVRNSDQEGATYGKNYYPPVLVFFKVIEKRKSNRVMEQHIYPLKRTNKMWPNYEYILGKPVYTLNLDKIKFRSIGKPIIIINEYNFY